MAGQPHAEVNAINSVQDKSILKEATIYVSLEPCSHFGKTPPCANLIIEHKIPNVVIGCIDSFSEVSGKGIKKLEDAGCNVTIGVLESECLTLNKRFFMYHNKKRPYIILKWAETQDGFIAPENNNGITWITNSYSKQLVHKLRATEQAILVGTNTALIDNPKLNTREWFGNSPTRIVIDRNLKIPKENYLLDESIKTIILTEEDKENYNQTFFEKIDFSDNLALQICKVLHQHQLQSIIIEGGSQTLQTFIDANLWDEAHVFTGETEFKNGVKAPELKNEKLLLTRKINNDTQKKYKAKHLDNSIELLETDILEYEIMSRKNLKFVQEEFIFLAKLEEMDELPFSEQYEGNYHDYFDERPIGEKPYSTESLKLSKKEFINYCLSKNIKPFNRITAHYGDNDIPFEDAIKNSIGFGESNSGFFANCENEIIKHIWFQTNNWSRDNIKNIITPLHLVGVKYDLILVSWNSKTVTDLSNLKEIEDFFL